MKHPAYISAVEPITLRDPLSALLGTFEDGLLEISYLDVVKSAGHSCPTVAGAYLMTQAALKALYGGETPVRGEIHVAFASGAADGVAGVIANVVTHITGATVTSGFKGLGGRFVRHGLMEFDADLGGGVTRFKRTDTGSSVDVSCDAGCIKNNPQQHALKPKIMQGVATAAERRLFGEIAQAHVADIFARGDQIVTVKAGV